MGRTVTFSKLAAVSYERLLVLGGGTARASSHIGWDV